MAEKEPLVGEQKGDNDADVHVTVEDGELAQRELHLEEDVTIGSARVCAYV